MARHAQITQNKKFAISLQYLKKLVNDQFDFLQQISTQNNKFTISLPYLKKEVSDGVHFLHADKH